MRHHAVTLVSKGKRKRINHLIQVGIEQGSNQETDLLQTTTTPDNLCFSEVSIEIQMASREEWDT